LLVGQERRVRMTLPITAKFSELGMPSMFTRFCRQPAARWCRARCR
jgi:hypothetical protein